MKKKTMDQKQVNKVGNPLKKRLRVPDEIILQFGSVFNIKKDDTLELDGSIFRVKKAAQFKDSVQLTLEKTIRYKGKDLKKEKTLIFFT